MSVGPKRKGHLPNVIFLKMAFFHFRGEHVGYRVQGGGAASAEILRELTSSGARVREDEIKNARLGEGIIDITFYHRNDTIF